MPHLQPLSWSTLVSTWDIDVATSLVCGLLLGGYAVCASRRHVGEHQLWRSACFVGGVILLWLSLSSGLAVYGRELFWLHMVLHLTLIMIVPALLVLGSPLRVVMDAGGERWMARARSTLTSAPVSLALHPASGLAVYTVVIVGTHLTSFMDEMSVHGWLEPLEVMLYLFGGWLLLTPLLGAEPIRRRVPALGRMALLVVAMMPDTVVGIVLLQNTTNPFPRMFPGTPWGPGPVQDVQTGGAVMWVGGDGLMMVFAVGVLLTVLAGPSQGPLLGTWLESVRRSTLDDLAGASLTGDGEDLDEEQSALDVYNRMLERRAMQDRY